MAGFSQEKNVRGFEVVTVRPPRCLLIDVAAGESSNSPKSSLRQKAAFGTSTTGRHNDRSASHSAPKGSLLGHQRHHRCS